MPAIMLGTIERVLGELDAEQKNKDNIDSDEGKETSVSPTTSTNTE